MNETSITNVNKSGIDNKTSKQQGNGDSSSLRHTEQPRSVRFAQSDTINEILALDEYTAEEIAASWLSNDETETIREKCRKVIHKMEKHGNSLNENRYCSRGLECKTGPRLYLLQQKRMKAYDAVLDLQQAQWEQGRDDQEQMAELYQHFSVQCNAEAICIGKKDALTVEDYASCWSKQKAQHACVA